MTSWTMGTRMALLAAGLFTVTGQLSSAAEVADLPQHPGALSTRSPRVGLPFQLVAADAISSIPPHVWTGVRRAGWQVHLAEFVLDAAPEWRDRQPRGWPSGSTWDNTDAIYLPEQRLLVIAEKRRDRAGNIVATTRTAGVLRHEMGHAFDMVSGFPHDFHSERPEFVAQYQADLRAMDESVAQRLQYFLQARRAGRQEAFSEAFAVVLGGGSAVEDQQLFRDAFPRVLTYVRRAIQQYRPEAPK